MTPSSGSDLPKVGVQVVAEGAEQAQQQAKAAIDAITKSTEDLEKAATAQANAELLLQRVYASGAAAAGDYAKAEQILTEAMTGSEASEIAMARAQNQLEAVQRKLTQATEEQAKADLEEAAAAEQAAKAAETQAEAEERINKVVAESMAKRAAQNGGNTQEGPIPPTFNDPALAAGAEEVRQKFQEIDEIQNDLLIGSEKLGVSWQKSFLLLSQFVDPKQALEDINQAQLEGITASQFYTKVLNDQFQEVVQNINADSDWVQVKEQLLEISEKNAEALKLETEQEDNLQHTAIQVGLAFFAFSIAARGVRDIGRELGAVYGDEVAQGFSKAADALQTIGSFGSGGALLGSLFGPEGTIIGAGIGGGIGAIAAIGTAIMQLPPEIEQLNQSLDSLGKKDETIATLSKILDISKEDAAALLELAKASPEAAKALDDLAKSKEPISDLQKVLEGFGIAWDNMIKKLDVGLPNGGIGGALEKGVIGAINQAIPGAGLGTMIEMSAEKYKMLADEARKTGAVQAEAELEAAKALQETQDQVDSLTKTYDAFLEKLSPTKDSLSELTGITADDTKTIEDYVKAHKDAGDALGLTIERIKELSIRQLEDKEHASQYTDELMKQIGIAKQQSDAILQAAENEKELAAASGILENAQKSLTAAMENYNHSLSELNIKTGQQRAEAQQQYNDTIANASRAESDAEANALQQKQDRLLDIWQQYSDKVANINRQLGDRVSDINQQLADRLAQIQQQLADRIADIEQQLQNKLQSLAHQRDQQIQQANQREADAAQQLSDKLYQIERTRIESLEDLAYNTGNQLRDAQSEHDRDRIRRDAQEKQAIIDRQANDQRQDAQKAYQEAIAQGEREKKQAEDNYNYEVMLAKELAAQQIAQARRAAAEQEALAKQQAAEQLAIAQREAAQQRADAERQAAEQRAQAQRTYDEQVAAAKKAEAEKQADAKRTLDERNKQIDQSYENERRQIEYTLQQALRAYAAQLAAVNNLTIAVAALLKAQGLAAGMYEELATQAANVTANLLKGWIGGIQSIEKKIASGGAGGASGLDMDVPAGYDNDSFMIRASSGEHVTITPPGMNNSWSNQAVNIYVYDATDPVKVGKEVRRQFAEATRGSR